MVGRALLGAGLALALGQAASAADWRAAGGDLFVGTHTALEPLTARLPALDQPFDAAVTEAARRYGLDPKLLHALIIVESAYRPEAVSPVGAAGLTQLMPATARDLGVTDRFDPAANLDGGAAYLAQQLRRFRDLHLALAAFNAGPERVALLGRVPAIPETRLYVDAVIQCFLTLSAGRSVTSARACSAKAAP